MRWIDSTDVAIIPMLGEDIWVCSGPVEDFTAGGAYVLDTC
jgi:hypothetical protein